MGGGRPNAVTISDSDVIVISNYDVILRSEGGGGQKRPKNCGHPKESPLIGIVRFTPFRGGLFEVIGN